MAGKLVHYLLLFGLPWVLHGPAAALIGAASYYATQVCDAGFCFCGASVPVPHSYCFALQGLVLASTFAVSHNVPESKPLDAGPTQQSLMQDTLERDWGVQQLLTSANWGGVIGNFFTGGLNLQVGGKLCCMKSWAACLQKCELTRTFYCLLHRSSTISSRQSPSCTTPPSQKLSRMRP